jgi:MarR family transcriptional regulator, organic hydroperoxide resistance regulator
VPLAEEVHRIGVEAIDAADIAIARRVLLTIIANLARDEVRMKQHERRIDGSMAKDSSAAQSIAIAAKARANGEAASAR